jgi:hypothetical protein
MLAMPALLQAIVMLPECTAVQHIKVRDFGKFFVLTAFHAVSLLSGSSDQPVSG